MAGRHCFMFTPAALQAPGPACSLCRLSLRDHFGGGEVNESQLVEVVCCAGLQSPFFFSFFRMGAFEMVDWLTVWLDYIKPCMLDLTQWNFLHWAVVLDALL